VAAFALPRFIAEKVRKEPGADRPRRGHRRGRKNSAGSRLLRDVEVRLDQHVVKDR